MGGSLCPLTAVSGSHVKKVRIATQEFNDMEYGRLDTPNATIPNVLSGNN